ncbi:hypothetical protein TUM4644_26470 [Shewanella colwelliana]|uniref:hypothetical protein n=1 Tax=Shewanella colwelliana TaxID=23 RepID=UPI001BBBD740|nr:hypothetical protein [Shewanella colwelliana]GIU28641.1 hypothetical protein TUM4644_26470 [Shewanella colwelliana]
MDAINQLLAHTFEEAIYHSDGYGHLQVQSTAQCDVNCAPADLLAQIEQAAQWPTFILAMKAQPDSWLLALSNHVPLDKHYSTHVLVELLRAIKTRDAHIALIQETPRWNWSSPQSPLLIDTVLKMLQVLIDDLTLAQFDTPQSCDISREIELAMFSDIVTRLVTIKHVNSKASVVN